jgi:hypothetical protein
MTITKQKIKEFWLRNNTKIVLILILFVFLSYSLFLATNLKRGIIPDEPAHLIFSKHYSTTWGIPKDIFETYSQGWYIQHNPFLYYWINGRVINLIQTIFPLISEWQILISLRILSVLYSIGTLLFCYLLSKEVVKGKWWQIVPVFLLSNTLMFVFLSGGVNYDNLANLLSMAGLVFLFRVLNKKSFVLNSILWMIFISFGALVKFTILPLALIMFIVWALFIYKNRNNLSLKVIRSNKIIILGIILVFAIVGNFRIYGVNIIKFGSLLPDCNQILPDEICELSPYVQRFNEIGLENKLSIKESIQLGYPNPLEYFFDSWIDFMLYRIYGILGHMSYFPSHIIIFYKILFFWIILLGFRYIEKPSFTFFSFLGIIGFYCCVLFIKNFSSELAYGFKQIAIQGRYLFPVIGLIYVLIPYTLEKNQNKPVRILTLSIAILLFFVGGPLKFVTHNQSIFLEWFIY